MNQKNYFAIITILALTVIAAACAGGGASNTPEQAVEAYVNALIAKDDVQSAVLSCADWESSGKAEGASFEGVEVALEDMACTVVDEADGRATVSCTGNIVFSYAGGEDERIGLDRRNYDVALEDGAWKMCGYK